MDSYFSDKLIRNLSYNPELTQNFIHAVLDRFIESRPVACYVYFLMLLEEYNPVKVVTDLESESFDFLFKNVLTSIEAEFEVNLENYKDMNIDASEYITSLQNAKPLLDKDSKKVKKDAARVKRDRIDRLASETRKIVHALPVYESMADNVSVSNSGKYWTFR